jgi:hypothetical protein
MTTSKIEQGSEHVMLNPEPPRIEFVDDRTERDIVIDNIGLSAFLYAREEIDNNGGINTKETWDYAGELYDSLVETSETPELDGCVITRHRYQAWFMLAFEIEQISSVMRQELGLEPKEFINEAEYVALNALKQETQ